MLRNENHDEINITLGERIKAAEENAKHTGMHDIPALATAMLRNGKPVKAHAFLVQYGF